MFVDSTRDGQVQKHGGPATVDMQIEMNLFQTRSFVKIAMSCL